MKIHENREVHFRGTLSLFLFLLVLISAGCTSIYPGELSSCVKYAWRFKRPVADDAATRFLGKVREIHRPDRSCNCLKFHGRIWGRRPGLNGRPAVYEFQKSLPQTI